MEQLANFSNAQLSDICCRLDAVVSPNLPPLPLMNGQEISTLADPFPIEVAGRLFLFCEVEGTADAYFKKIAIFEYDRHTDSFQYLQQLFKSDDFEYSFPFLFKWEGWVYLFPEITCEKTRNKQVKLYKTREDEFPLGWQEVVISIPEKIKFSNDKIILRFNDLWWMFCSSAVSGGQLMLAYSPDLIDWKLHEKFCIASRSITERLLNKVLPLRLKKVSPWRLGGGPFLLDGKVSFFLQHMYKKRVYGEALSLLTIDELNHDNIKFKIEKVPRICANPQRGWKSQACHHFAAMTSCGKSYIANDGFDGEKWASHLLSL